MTAFIPPQLIEQIRRNGQIQSAEHSAALTRAGMSEAARRRITRPTESLSAAFDESSRAFAVELSMLEAAAAAGRPLSDEEIDTINDEVSK